MFTFPVRFPPPPVRGGCLLPQSLQVRCGILERGRRAGSLGVADGEGAEHGGATCDTTDEGSSSAAGAVVGAPVMGAPAGSGALKQARIRAVTSTYLRALHRVLHGCKECQKQSRLAQVLIGNLIGHSKKFKMHGKNK
nr:unnamed protein product [Callosobruchus analis]